MDTLRTIEGVGAFLGAGLLLVGLVTQIESLTVPGGLAILGVGILELSRAWLSKSAINPPQPPDLP